MNKFISWKAGLTATCSVMVGMCVYTAPANASGFPTVDIAALVQRISTYQTELQQYSTLLTSTTTQFSQLTQLYQDYEQVLLEYEHFLRQIRGLERIIDRKDWLALMKVVEPYYGASVFSAVAELDPDSPTFADDVVTLLRRYTSPPETEAVFDERVESLRVRGGEILTAENGRINAAYERQMDLYKTASNNELLMKERDREIERYQGLLQSLGDESDVATLQAIATGVQMSLAQNQQAMRLQNQILMNTELESARDAERKAMFFDRELSRVERAMTNPVDSFTVDVDGM